MSNLRTMIAAAAICVVAGPATAETTAASQHVSLARLLTPNVISRNMRRQEAASPIQNMSIRGGVMFSPRGAGVAGVDFSLPTLSIGAGWHGRVDADVIFKANLGGVNTAIPITLNQLYWTPNAGGPDLYYGGGVGAIFGGNTSLAAKLILGADITERLGAEFNLHFTDNATLMMVVARFHL